MVENCGISFGFKFDGLFWIIGLILIFLTIYLLFLTLKNKRLPLGWGILTLGGWANFGQRLGGGCVIDNLSVPFLPIKNNVFDWLIFGGMVLIIGGEIWKKRE
ncbi:MAG: signal peptidase II [Candidatus Shapirobacteria bacterium]|jgi:lipoprotein signal peptidase